MNPLLIGTILDVGKQIISKVWSDPASQAEAQLKLLQLQQEGAFKELDTQMQLALAQIAINQADAQSSSNWRGGWRPCIGWICGVGLSYQFILQPLINGGLQLIYGVQPMPDLDISNLMGLIVGMLGMGGLRTYEKIKGKA